MKPKFYDSSSFSARFPPKHFQSESEIQATHDFLVQAPNVKYPHGSINSPDKSYFEWQQFFLFLAGLPSGKLT